MDPFEAAPVNYSRDMVVVESDGRTRHCVDLFRQRRGHSPGLRPERQYLEHLLAGRDYLSPRYFAWLSETACVDD